MAKELQVSIGITGLTVTAKLYLNGVIANSGAAVSCPEYAGQGGLYQGDMPAIAAGIYFVQFFSAGSVISAGELAWNGVAEVPPIITPVAPPLVVGWLICLDVNNAVLAGVTHTVNFIRATDGDTGNSFDGGFQTAVSASNGLVQFNNLLIGATYQIRRASGDWVEFVAQATTFELPDCNS